MGQKEKLSPKQAAFLVELLAGNTITEAAARVGVARRTATAWRSLPAISEAIESASQEAVEAGGVRLSSITGLAVATLERLMTVESTPAAVQAQAARTVLATVSELRTEADIIDRLKRLESALEEQQADDGYPNSEEPADEAETPVGEESNNGNQEPE